VLNPDSGGDAGLLAAIGEMLDRPGNSRLDVLADKLVEFGPRLAGTLTRAAQDPEAAGFRVSDREELAMLAGQAEPLLVAWLTGERITSRADEGDRRVLALKRAVADDPGDPVFGRLAADAVMRLPSGHELRDAEFARRVLMDQADRARRPEGDADDLLMAVYYLLHHQLISRGDFAGLVDETIAAVGDRTPDPAAVRDFLEAAHNYCIWQAGDIMAEDEDPAAWLTLGEQLLTVAGDESLGLGLGPRLTGMRARQLDLAGDAQRAADAYAEYLTASPPGSRKGMWSALSEATLRLQTGEYQRVLDRLEPMAEGLLDWYLTAVIDADIADAGLAHGRAVALMASALTHLGRLDDAVGLIDTAKSARLRYRVSLQQHPSRTRVLELERALLEVSRSVPGQESAGEQGLLLRAQLLEQYRRLRPDLGDQIGRVRSVTEMSEVLQPDEAVVSLAAFDDMTTVTLITPAGSLFAMRLPAWPWSRWDALLDGPGGWRRFLAGRTAPGADDAENQQVSGHDALDVLIRAADRVLGESIGELIGHAGEGIRRVIVVPHRWLHLIPYWALPSLAEFPAQVISSISELVTSRTDPVPVGPARNCLVVTNPTGDLLCSASEAESVARTMPAAGQLAGRQASAEAIADALSGADFFHYSGHAYSDHADPDRSALLVALPAGQTLNPFPDWAVASGSREPGADGWRTGQVPGVGLLSTRAGPDQQMELRMERGAAPTLYARYAGGRLRQLGELWSVGDILALGREAPCQLAFLSACQAGVAGGKSAYIDEYGGLPAALRLGGVASVVCSLWEVDEGFTALYTDLFYARLPAGQTDPVTVVRQVGRELREARKPDVLRRLDRLADQVRARSPRAALALEGYRAKIEAERGDFPYARPWEWASFYANGGGILNLAAPAERKGA
jgi:CHAT domain-containing protein